MDVDAVALFLALLAVVAQLVVLGLLALRALGRGHVLADLGATAHPALLAWPVALVAVAGSLYLSEVAGFPPCHLCWAQRAAIYPQAVLLPLAGLARQRWARVASLGLLAVGALVSAYHVVLERVPDLETGACDPDNPCTIIWVEQLGYLTIPAMALTAQVAIAALLLLVPRPKEAP